MILQPAVSLAAAALVTQRHPPDAPLSHHSPSCAVTVSSLQYSHIQPSINIYLTLDATDTARYSVCCCCAARVCRLALVSALVASSVGRVTTIDQNWLHPSSSCRLNSRIFSRYRIM